MPAPAPGGGAAVAGGLPPGMPPEMAQAVQQIIAENPELGQLLEQNPEAFLQLLQQEAAGMDAEGLGDLEGLDLSPEGLEGLEGLEDEEMGGPDVELTPDEQAAVERIAALGFDPNQALEAYLACDKNENLAANFLFDNMGA